MKLKEQSKITLEKLQFLSGTKRDDLRIILESLEALIILNYLEGEPTTIPFFGTIMIKHIDDISVDGKLQAKVEIDFEPDNSLLRNIGQIKDGDETDIEKMMKRRIQASLGHYLEV